MEPQEEIKKLQDAMKILNRKLNEIKELHDKQTGTTISSMSVSPEWPTESKETDKISPALVGCKNDLPPIGVDAKGYNFKYVSYPGILEQIKPLLKRYKLCVDQPLVWIDNNLFIITKIRHESGQWIRDKMFVSLPNRKETPSNKDYNQECGKAISYMRRYALESIMGIKGDKDEDYDAR